MIIYNNLEYNDIITNDLVSESNVLYDTYVNKYYDSNTNYKYSNYLNPNAYSTIDSYIKTVSIQFKDFIDSDILVLNTISDQMILDSINAYIVKYDKPSYFINLEEAKLVFSIILTKISYYKKTYGGKKKYKMYVSDNHMVQIPATEWRTWIQHQKYAPLLTAFLDSGFIETDNHFYFNYDNGTKTGRSKAKSFKIADKYMVKNEEGKYYTRKKIESKYLIKRFLDYKIKIIEKAKQGLPEHRQKMIDHVVTLLPNVDLHAFEMYFKDHLDEYYDVEDKEDKEEIIIAKENDKETLNLSEFVDVMKNHKERGYYFNGKDVFGERFHSPFTNTTKKMRDYVLIAGERPVERDIVNSQMVILATIIRYPEQSTRILPEFSGDIKKLQKIKNKPDVVEFCKRAENGTLYEWIGSEMNVNRKDAKSFMFKMLFSKWFEFKPDKDDYNKVIPNIIEICGKLNGYDKKTIPKMCQRFESRVMIDMVGKGMAEQSEHPFYTVHDSFAMHPSDLPLFESIYKGVFEKLEIPLLKLK